MVYFRYKGLQNKYVYEYTDAEKLKWYLSRHRILYLSHLSFIILYRHLYFRCKRNNLVLLRCNIIIHIYIGLILKYIIVLHIIIIIIIMYGMFVMSIPI